jgi:proline dehydrogenase
MSVGQDIMRRGILRLADSHSVRGMVERTGPALGAYRFVAGNTIADAVSTVRRLGGRGLMVTLDHLGESVQNEAEARAAGAAYLEALDALKAAGVMCHASLKLTQMGLDLSEDLCRDVVVPILERARALDTFVRIDMEDSAHTDVTLRLFREVRARNPHVGIVLQAYLYRSGEDLRELAQAFPGLNVRIVKGAYLEPPSVAYAEKVDVDRNYLALVAQAMEAGVYTAVATHDEAIIGAVRQDVAERGLGRDRFEFQMLYGIRSGLQEALAKEGYRVRVYVPYGPDWYAYFMRRLAERPANVWFFLANLVRH